MPKMNCQFCGKEFSYVERKNHTTHCSISCFYKTKYREKVKRAVRGYGHIKDILEELGITKTMYYYSQNKEPFKKRNLAWYYKNRDKRLQQMKEYNLRRKK